MSPSPIPQVVGAAFLDTWFEPVPRTSLSAVSQVDDLVSSRKWLCDGAVKPCCPKGHLLEGHFWLEQLPTTDIDPGIRLLQV
jgi:hypothetical protein